MSQKQKDACVPGCGKCCGIALTNGQNFTQITKYAAKHGIEPIKQGSQCPWYQNHQCAIYEVRPSTCRLFGKIANPNMQCHEGGKFHQLRAPEVARVEERERTLVQEHGMRFLHEACYTTDEIKEIIDDITKRVSQTKLTQIQNLGLALKADTERLSQIEKQ